MLTTSNGDRPPCIIGIDLAKNVFQLHAEDTVGKLLWRKRLSREAIEPFLRKQAPALIGMVRVGPSLGPRDPDAGP